MMTAAHIDHLRRYAYKGEQLTALELARLAGCTKHDMLRRLARMGAAAAVALGTKAATKLSAKSWSRQPRLYPYQGRQVTCIELAQMAGVDRGTMRMRLLEMTAEQAVALGRNESQVRRPAPTGKTHLLGGKLLTLREAAEKTGIRLSTLRGRCKTLTLEQAVAMGQPNKGKRPQALLKPQAPLKAAPQGPRSPFAPGAQPVTPPHVRPSCVAAPRGRLEVAPGEAPAIFSRLGPGRYEPTGTAIERAFGGGR